MSNSTQNDEIKQMEKAIDEGFAESEKFLKGMKTPFDKPTQNDPIINGEWGSPAPYKVNRWVKKDSTQNDHETHTACIERIRKEGASSTCCYCDPHEGCTLGMKPTQNDWEHDYVMDIINIVGVMTTATQYGKIDKILTKLRADARKEVIEKVEKIDKKKIIDVSTISESYYNQGYNQAVSDVLATLREEEKHG